MRLQKESKDKDRASPAGRTAGTPCVLVAHHELCEADIGDLGSGLVAGEQDVLGLQVAVHHVVAVQEVQAARDVHRDLAAALVPGQLAHLVAGQSCAQIAALAVLQHLPSTRVHHVKGPATLTEAKWEEA